MDALAAGLASAPLASGLAVAAAVAERYAAGFAAATLKGAVLLGAAAVATRAMRRASAASRHLVWSAAVAGVLALPLVEAVAPRWTLPILPAAAPAAAPASAPPDPRGAPASAGVVTAAPDAAAGLPAPPIAVVDVPQTRASRLLGWAALVWAAGAALVLARLALGTAGLARLVRRARPADDPAWVMLAQRLARELGIRRPVTLLIGRSGTVPVTWGVVYPVVLLPADADAWSPARRRAVLLHELAHVERFDALTHTLSQLALALFWFDPLVALAARRLRAERERACDDLVLAAGTRATEYAGDLLELVQTLGEPGPAAAALAMARRSEFEGRLLAILDPAVPRMRTSRRATLGAAACAAAAIVPLAAMRPAPAPAAAARRAPSAAPVPPASAAAARPAAVRTSPAVAGADAPPPAVGRGGRAAPADGRRASEGATQPPRASLAVLTSAAAAVRGISADADKAAVLRRLAPRAGESAELRAAFFDAAMTIAGDGERSGVLLEVLRHAGDAVSVAGALAAARGMASDGERAAVLRAAATTPAIGTSEVRDAFFQSAAGLVSPAELEAVLTAALRARPADPEIALAAVAATSVMTSDRSRANVLLEAATRTPILARDGGRAAFFAALATMRSSAEYRRVMEAVAR